MNWIAVDWGTSNLRLWAMSATGDILAEKFSDQGIGKIGQHDFEGIFLSLASNWLDDEREIPVIACGMLGSRQGWIETPYDSLPCSPATSLTRAPTKDRRIAVWILAGVKNHCPGKADVMRGEETQIAGYISNFPNFTGIICLPGTHSKWVQLMHGKLMDFNTAMTGELFDVIGRNTILKQGPGCWDDSVFLAAVKQGYKNPAGLAADLFSIRARYLLEDDKNGRAYLSGLLIGNEIAGQQKMIKAIAPKTINIIGDSRLAGLYRNALRHLKISADLFNANQYTLTGLYQAYREMIK